MKTTLFVLFLAINYSSAQSISDHFEIEEIKQIEISFKPTMGIDNTENKVTKTIKDRAFIAKITMLINKLPAKGGIYISFSQSIPTWRIELIDQDNKSSKLTFYGNSLRVPDSSNGSFYFGGQKIGDLEKKLYLAIRSEMIGDWYNCD